MTDLLPDAVVRYGEHELAVIDLHLPAQWSTPGPMPGPTPGPMPWNGTLVVLVHGGFWKERYDRTHTRAQARALADGGYLVATPEYRRVGGGGGWPTTGTDLETALNALPALAEGLGFGWDRAVLTGHSAGGHLALWLLSRDLSIEFEVVVGVAPVCDLALADRLHLGDDAVRRLLDGAPIADADPATLLTARPTAAVRLVHGVLDEAVPVELSRGFVTAHPWTELIELRGVGHFEFLDPTTPAWAAVVEELVR